MVQLRRRACVIAAAVWIAAPVAALAQPRRYRVGLLFGSSGAGVTSEMATSLDRLAELGYVQGKNLEVVPRFADGEPARFSQLAREILEQDVEVGVRAQYAGSAGAAEVLRSRRHH